MIREAVSWAIVRAVDEGGDPKLAFRAFSQIDPIVRFMARRKLRRTLQETSWLTHLTSEAVRDLHLLRLCLLALTHSLPFPHEVDDLPLVAARYEAIAASVKPPRRGWWTSGL